MIKVWVDFIYTGLYTVGCDLNFWSLRSEMSISTEVRLYQAIIINRLFLIFK